jgi:AcrR family transcriptional regulator
MRRRADARRLEILRAAARVFRQRGLAAAGMRDIAIAADLSLGNLYHYFEGKDEILFFCQDRTLDRLLAALAEARRLHRTTVGRLSALAHAHVLCLLDEVHGAWAHLEVGALPPALREVIVAKRDRYEHGVRALVAAGVRRGDLRRTDPTIAARTFLGALNGTAQWFRPEGPFPPERVAALVADFAVAGLVHALPEGGAGAPTRPDHADRQRRTDRGRLRLVQDAPRGAS